jgi:predicted dinucleotide-binding enzyme
MKISLVGTGRMGKALIQTLVKHNIDVAWAGRDLNKLQQLKKDLNLHVSAQSLNDMFDSDIIIPAFRYTDSLEWVSKNKEKLKNKILIDINVPFDDTFTGLLTSADSSASEIIQQLLPESKVVGMFKNTFWMVFEQAINNGIMSDVYVTANDEDLRNKVIEVFSALPFRFFDAGNLSNNRTIERMTLLSRELSIKAGTYPYVSFHLWGGVNKYDSNKTKRLK